MCSTSCTNAPGAHQVLGPDGRVLAQVATLNGLKDGAAILHLRNHGSKQGRYDRGLKTGPWLETDAKGDTVSIAGYARGRAEGLWWQFTNGRPTYLAYYSNGVEQGPRIQWYPNGAPASLVRFAEGHEEGTAHYWNMKDTVNVGMHATGRYADGKPEGVWRRYYSDGVLCNENPYRNGLRHGIWTLWSRNGEVLRKIEYRFDKRVRTVVDELK